MEEQKKVVVVVVRQARRELFYLAVLGQLWCLVAVVLGVVVAAAEVLESLGPLVDSDTFDCQVHQDSSVSLNNTIGERVKQWERKRNKYQNAFSSRATRRARDLRKRKEHKTKKAANRREARMCEQKKGMHSTLARQSERQAKRMKKVQETFNARRATPSLSSPIFCMSREKRLRRK